MLRDFKLVESTTVTHVWFIADGRKERNSREEKKRDQTSTNKRLNRKSEMQTKQPSSHLNPV